MRPLFVSLCIVVANLVGQTATNAEVILYKGVDRRRENFSSEGAFPSSPVTYYLLVDVTEPAIAQLVTFKTTGGEKKYRLLYSPPVRIGTPALKGGKTATLVAGGQSSDAAVMDWSFYSLNLLGTNETFVVKKVPSEVQVTAPRVFTGTSQLTFRGVDRAGFTIDTVSAKLQAARTVEINNAGQTLNQAFLDLIGDLEAKGFTQ